MRGLARENAGVCWLGELPRKPLPKRPAADGTAERMSS